MARGMIHVAHPYRIPDVLFFFNDTATTEIYTLSLHDALPIFLRYADELQISNTRHAARIRLRTGVDREDRKSTRLNSSHVSISYAVFCLKKKNNCSTRSHNVWATALCTLLFARLCVGAESPTH